MHRTRTIDMCYILSAGLCVLIKLAFLIFATFSYIIITNNLRYVEALILFLIYIIINWIMLIYDIIYLIKLIKNKGDVINALEWRNDFNSPYVPLLALLHVINLGIMIAFAVVFTPIYNNIFAIYTKLSPNGVYAFVCLQILCVYAYVSCALFIISFLPIRFNKIKFNCIYTFTFAIYNMMSIKRYLNTKVYVPQPPIGNICILCHKKKDTYDTWRILQCNHYFHKDCVNDWINEHNNCPYCKCVINLYLPRHSISEAPKESTNQFSIHGDSMLDIIIIN